MKKVGSDRMEGRLSFGSFEFDPGSGELRLNGELRHLRPQATIVLRCLLESHPQLTTHEELRHAVWGETFADWEAGTHQIVRQLRRALDDDAHDASFIETVPRRGYRFKVDPEVVGSFERVKRPALGYLAAWTAGVLTVPLAMLLGCWLLAVLVSGS